MEDPNIAKDSFLKISTFEIIIVWELDFVKIVKMSKILKNKDYNLSTKPSYHEILTHAWSHTNMYQKQS